MRGFNQQHRPQGAITLCIIVLLCQVHYVYTYSTTVSDTTLDTASAPSVSYVKKQVGSDRGEAGVIPAPQTSRGHGLVPPNHEKASHVEGDKKTTDSIVTARVSDGEGSTGVPIDKCKLSQYPGLDPYLGVELDVSDNGDGTVSFMLCGPGVNMTCGTLTGDIGVCYQSTVNGNDSPFGLESTVKVEDYYGLGIVASFNTGQSGYTAYVYMQCYNLVSGIEWNDNIGGVSNGAKVLYVEGKGNAACPTGTNPSPSSPVSPSCQNLPGFANADRLSGSYSQQIGSQSMQFDFGLCAPLFEPCNTVPIGVAVCGWPNSSPGGAASTNAVSYGTVASTKRSVYYNNAVLYEFQTGSGVNANYATVIIGCDPSAGVPIQWDDNGSAQQYVWMTGTSSAACPTAGFSPSPQPSACSIPTFPNMQNLAQQGPFSINPVNSNYNQISFSLCSGLLTVCGSDGDGKPAIGVSVCGQKGNSGSPPEVWGEAPSIKTSIMVNNTGVRYEYTGFLGQRTTTIEVTCNPGTNGVSWDNDPTIDDNSMIITGVSGFACAGPAISPTPDPSPNPSPVASPSPVIKPTSSPGLSPTPKTSPSTSPGTSPKPSNKNNMIAAIGVTSGVVLLIGFGLVCAYGFNRRRRLKREKNGEIPGDPYEHPFLFATESTSLLGSVPNITWGSNAGISMTQQGPRRGAAVAGGGGSGAIPHVGPPPGSTSSVSLMFKTDPKLGIPEFDFSQVAPFLTEKNRLARGGFGEVFVFEHQERAVALKRAFVDMDDKEYAERVRRAFCEEASLLFRLRHQNILKVYAASLTLPNLCFISEYMERNSLFKVLKNSKIDLDLDRRLDILVQVATGMQFLHSQSPVILHRDLKSLNILIGKEWNVKIADFGLARSCQQTHLSTAHQHAGSPAWMAPELLRDQERSVSTKVDVYAFGVVMWEVMTRETPWQGQAHHAIIRRVGLQGERLSTAAVMSAFEEFGVAGRLISDDYCAILKECFAEDGRSRPDFAHLRERLRTMLDMFVA